MSLTQYFQGTTEGFNKTQDIEDLQQEKTANIDVPASSRTFFYFTSGWKFLLKLTARILGVAELEFVESNICG